MSEIVEVTDGDRIDRARFRVPASGGDQSMSGWHHEDGMPLDWQPTHWRPLARKRQIFVVD
ncbi:hypothetical protein [Bosea sp. BK604]|uniref:hypothetical protein n=1 Tax=Bosea sp. BK604 TaxID=2512180 RepID=UPI00104FA902|nr:hypothetical protein [Bosea sp. BK604]